MGNLLKYKKVPPHNLRECVLVSLWGVREAGSCKSPNRFTEYTCTESVRGGANNPGEVTRTHTNKCMCTHAAHQQVEPVQRSTAASESHLLVKVVTN